MIRGSLSVFLLLVSNLPVVRGHAGSSANSEIVLDGSAPSTLALDLEAGDYLYVAVRPLGLDITLELAGPDGSEHWSGIDRPTAEGKEEIWFVAPSRGAYVLQVASRWGEPGSAVVESLTHRPATDSDRLRVQAEAERRDGETERRRSGGSQEAALELFRNARRDFEALGLPDRAGEAATRESIVLARLGRVDEAEELLAQEREAAHLRGDRTTEARAVNSIAVRAYGRGDLRRAIDMTEEAKRIGPEDPLLATMLEINTGLWEALAGEHRRAAEQFRQAARAAHDLGFRNGEASAWFNASLAHRGLRDYRAYFEDLRRADPLLAQLGQAVDQGRLRMNEGIAYVDLGMPEKAAERFRGALDVLPEAETQERARAHLNLGQVALELGDTTEARAEVDRCLEMVSGQSLPKLEGSAHAIRAEIDLAQGQSADAVAEARRSVDLARSSGVERILPDALVTLAQALTESGDLEAADTALSEALAVGHRQEDPKIGVTARLARARLSERRGELTEAISEVEAGIAGVEELRSEVPTLVLQATLLARYRSLFDLGIELRYELARSAPQAGHAAAAFALAERSRARSLLDSLPALAWRSDPATERLRDLGAAVVAARQERAAQLTEEADSEGQTEADRELDRAILDYETARRAWITDNPREAGRLDRRPADLPAVQAALAPDETLLEYHAGEERTFLFLLTRDRFRMVNLGATSDLERDVDEFLAQLLRPSVRGATTYLEVAWRLFQQILPPAQVDSLSGRRVLVSPDGPLAGVPFEALVTKRSGGTFAELPYLGNAASFSYLPSAAVGLELRARQPSATGSRTLVAFADPTPTAPDKPDFPTLPGAREEVATLTDMLAPSIAWLGAEARESRVRALSESPPRYLHFATHTMIDERRPELSAVLLAAAGDDDGRLEGWEIASLNLPVQQVVLAACGSALGRPVPGEGLVGLVQAFFDAGARSVVASFWPVVDRSTRSLMVDFYRGLENAGSVPALAQARRAQIARGGLSAHPYYWASFVIFGAGEPPTTERR